VKAHRAARSKSFGFGFQAGEARRLVGLSNLWGKELAGELGEVPLPDLLHLEPRISNDRDAVHELLELAFLGKEAARGLDSKMGDLEAGGVGWKLDFFARDLFVDDLIRETLTLELGGIRFPVNVDYLRKVLSDPPTEIGAVRFRQEILAELEADRHLRRSARELYRELTALLSMFKSPDHAAQLDINAYRLDILHQARTAIDRMAEDFKDAKSGLRRLSEAGEEIRRSPQYRLLAEVLEFESRLGSVLVRLGVGGDGTVKRLEILDAAENTDNRFYRSPLRRAWIRVKLFLFYGYRLGRKEIVNRLLREVFLKISPALTPLVRLVGQLELYLAGLGFRRRAAERGLETSLADFDDRRPPRLESVWNPLLLAREEPVPCRVECSERRPIVLITGPNSGGKTRLLQTVGLSQLLGQSGLYVPAASATLPLVQGMFVSLVETETADQAEGRLGREMVRIRSLFETLGSPSMVILDELCSGTNPAEGTEIFALVVQLLDRLGALAFISTHYLDFARGLADEPPVQSLEFLRVETRDDLTPTYQFLPGVADSSLAAAIAERLGFTFEKLSALIDERRGE